MAEKNNSATAVSAISLHEVVASENTEPVKDDDFTNVTLDTEKKPKRLVLKDPAAPDFENKKNKVPRRVIHFSDGILEEYSESEDEDEVDKTPAVDPKTLKWLPWFWFYMTKSAKGTLRVADICGEKLAWFLGITSPKYQHAIDEYKRMKKQEKEEKEREEKEKEFQRQRKLQGAGLDVEGGAPTYSNKAFGLEVEEGASANPPNLAQNKDSSSKNSTLQQDVSTAEEKF